MNLPLPTLASIAAILLLLATVSFAITTRINRRHPPEGETAIRFRADGSVRLAKTRALLDTEPALAAGTWKLDGPKLTITYDQGICSDQAATKAGVYNVVISKIGIHFTRVEDPCERRAAIDGSGNSTSGSSALFRNAKTP